MFFSNFNIRFSNKVSRTGYKWEGDELALKQDGGFKEVEYSIDTFVDFLISLYVLLQTYLN